MLSKLYIQNYAIIDLLEITFSDKLNIITGETGAGKSILMGALNLILGERADASALQTGAKKCIVEGTFSQASPQVNDFFIANNLEEGEEIIMRREVAVGGKSRAFINDTPVNLAQLKELGLLLVDLHQQFDTLELSSLNFQRMVLDALGKNATLLSQFRKVYMQYVEIKKELENLLAMQAAAEKEMGYHQFLFDELQALHLQPDELEQADLQLAALSNAENNKQQLLAVYFQLKDAEQPIVQQLKVLQQKLGGLSKYFPTIEALHQRIGSTVIELKDVADELENVETGIHYDPAQIELLNERLAQGYKLQKKHGVQSTAALLAIQAALSTKLEAVHTAGEQIENYTKETTKLESQAREIAKRISANRHAAIAPFVKKVNALLTQVGMPNANLKVVVQNGNLSALGSDEIEFLFDANLPSALAGKIGRYEPLRKVASGGELSRLMLTIKSLVAQELRLPTLIFDEIDSGISGEAAKQVGSIMKRLSANHQLIAITHQPQIAAKADAHHFVFKQLINDKLVTAIRLLKKEEQVTAIAQMLSGEKPTAAALENAREMIANSGLY